ncbi:2OG-Fe(II) oxygenase [Sphingomonas sp. CL5.1]|uniref:2OG-Fe(II) oxygenase n=1 Tax=Sphingomonas sp. CL5.1 TaxID=2653203 RepID=UPI00158437F6|nr:2OG-Fe(II) oxygenase [Sphingomonas sp. CL5.1]QKR99449.1 2OG-Fe(II) oxygenase [Sphingomonas sp. CL5.1]
MSVLTFAGSGYSRFDKQECEREGEARAESYRTAAPFPHIVIDDFLDKSLLRNVAAHYPPIDKQQFFDRDQERFKYQFQPAAIDDPVALNLLAELNSEAFISFLEKMTGIEGLIPDPYFVGGGLHLTRKGGHLGVHADFNLHNILKLERRLNLLVYLNDDWDEAWGGSLELWDRQMKACEVRVAPDLGRAVVFSTSLDSFHGHPDPLACPDHRDRRSIATYYYTAFDAREGIVERTTNFRARPGTGDRADRAVSFRHFVNDWVPPRLQRYANRLNPFT